MGEERAGVVFGWYERKKEGTGGGNVGEIMWRF